jgi:RNA 2',3'-cyclic 3'-phosphodiesterase
MKRIFIAIKVKPEAKLAGIMTSLRSGLARERITWVDPANIHLTLAFLGNTEEARIRVVEAMLAKECNGFGEFCLTLKGSGVFRSIRDPRVIWVGIENPELVTRLNDKIINGLADNGFKPDNKPFRPHITLGRIKQIMNPEVLSKELAKHAGDHVQEVEVKEVILYESILQSTGPVYKPLGSFSLKG